MAPKKVDPWERFLQKVVEEDSPLSTPCWIWTGAQFKGRPYFQAASRKTVNAYVWAWEYVNGPRPRTADGRVTHDLHHLCERTLCVNPGHLEFLSPLEHRAAHGPTADARKTHCNAGHALTPDNVYLWVNPVDGYTRRKCRICKRAAWNRWAARQ